MGKKNKSFQPKAMSVTSSAASATSAAKPTGVEMQLPQTTSLGAVKLPPDVEKKLQALKTKLDSFKEKVLEKFGDYIVGIALLPPPQPAPPSQQQQQQGLSFMPQQQGQSMMQQQGQSLVQQQESAALHQGTASEQPKKEERKEDKEQQIELLVVVDDTTSQKMTKDELHQKFSGMVKKIGEEVDKNILPQSILLTDLWLNCYDGKFELNRLISLSAPIYDTGMLAAIKIAEVHKSMVIKKFEKYIMSYVLAGSLVQGKATPTSDIDIWIVIDDTDVKKMSRVELKDKLRAIIIGMGIEAGDMTGIRNKINIQVYILTDFWDSLKEANPIIFTLLRDGVPFYDRGIFMPWKQLLRMGRIKPSREAIDLFMSTGDQSIKRVKGFLKTMGMEDTFYAILTPTQAAIMLYGLPPPTPKETPEVMEEIFVKKEKMLEPEYVKILKANVDLRKDLEHGVKTELTGTELDKYIKNAEKYLQRISELFKEIERRHDEKGILALYDEIMTIIRDVLKEEGIEKAQDEEMVKLFEDELISTGKVPARYLRDFNEIMEAKRKYDAKKLDKADIEKARKGSTELVRFLIEYLQRKRGKELERAKIRVKHGERKYGEVLLLDKIAFVTYDIDAKEQQIEKAVVNEDGSLGTLHPSSLEELEKALASMKMPPKVFIKEPIFEDLKRIFGSDVEVLVNA